MVAAGILSRSAIPPRPKGLTMSFQAYLDNVEAKTGKTPQQFIDMADAKGLTRHSDIVEWLKTDFQLGTGHARAIAHVIVHGPR
jgi:hypothetical protein